MSKPSPENRHISVMDTTLRDGEQTPEVAYTPAEKLQLARLLLLDVEVDRIEIASSRVSEGERDAAQKVCGWARKERCLQRVEILGYCDGKASVDWIANVGGKVLNLLTKGSEQHCRSQLRQTPEKHREAVRDTIRYARRRRMQVNVYLEDWSNGVQDSFDYVYAMVQLLRELRVARIYIPDTLGILSPEATTRTVGLMTTTWPEVDFEFHSHNDYNLATANCLAAIGAGARGVHTSVNGLGERAGNTRLAEVVAAIHAGKLIIEKMDCYDIDLRLYGEFGVLWYSADARTSDGETTFEGKVRCTTVYAWRDGSWEMITQHQSRLGG